MNCGFLPQCAHMYIPRLSRRQGGVTGGGISDPLPTTAAGSAGPWEGSVD